MQQAGATQVWREALALFERWAAEPEAGRAALLDETRDQHPELHPRLLALIAADRAAEAQDFLGRTGAALDDALPALADDPSAALAGRLLGPWRLLEPIASGGMGQVWLATRSDGMHSGRAAVKLLHGISANASVRARFAHEGELLSRLTHPHIAQLLDAGLVDDGTRYLVLEYVQGERLDRWCDSRALPVPDRLRLFLQVCEAVTYAHGHLVVHRDLKPANILVSEPGHVKLLDFGVAKLLGDDTPGPELTRAGSAGLTLEYAAPEQVTGEPVSTRTDVYALGVLLCVLLSGQGPYGTANSSPAQLARDIVESDARRLVGHGDLAHIVERALQKQPAQRYASVQALADDIGRHLRHEPVSAQAPTLAYRSAKFMRRHRVAVAAASLVALAVGAGLGATLWQARLAQLEAAKATAIKNFLLGVFNNNRIGADAQDVQARQDTTARQLLEEGGTRLLAERTLPPAVRGELLSTLGALHDSLGLATSSVALSAAAQGLACTQPDSADAACVAALVAHAHALQRNDQIAEAVALARDAVARAERGGLQRSASYGEALYTLGASLHLQGDMAGAQQHLAHAVQVYEQHAPTHPQHSEALHRLGNTHIVLEDFDAAVGHIQRALALAETQHDLREYSRGALEYALADAYSSAGRVAEALPHFERAIALSAQALGPRHPHVWMMRLAQGRWQHQLGATREGRAAVEAALDAGRDDRMPLAANLRDRSQAALASMALDEGDIASALALNGPLVQRYTQQGAGSLAPTLLRQAEMESLAGRADAAIAAGRRAMQLFDRQSGATTVRARDTRVVLAEALLRTGGSAEQAEAQRLLDAVLAPRPADAPAAPPSLALQQARARVGLARLALVTDPAAALSLARSAATALDPGSSVLRVRLVLAQAALAEGRALIALERPADARTPLDRAVALLVAMQAADSPRLAEVRAVLAALPG